MDMEGGKMHPDRCGFGIQGGMKHGDTVQWDGG